MKPYALLECPDIELISRGIYDFVQTKTTLLESNAIGWQFLDYKQLLKHVPSLLAFFTKEKLMPDSASVVILHETGQLPLHVDELPVVAKINFPVINTKGWTTKWYSISDDDLNSCAKVKNQFGSEIEQLSSLPETAFTFAGEIRDHANSVVVFNSRIPHEVIRINGNSPRIIASFTFVNEPLHLLK